MGGAGLCSPVTDERMCGNSTKQLQGRFRLDNRKNFFTTRVVKHWNGLPSEVADAPCLAAFKRQLENALINTL